MKNKTEEIKLSEMDIVVEVTGFAGHATSNDDQGEWFEVWTWTS